MKIKSNYKKIISKNFISLILINYLFLNRYLIRLQDGNQVLTKELIFNELPIWFLLLTLNLTILIIINFKNISLNTSPLSLATVFFLFQIQNIFNIPADYFWNTIPDSRTYKQLGLSFFECGKLSMSCNDVPLLDWPPGQPIISGFLYKFIPELSPILFLLIFCCAFYLILRISKIKSGNLYVIGAIYFFLLSNNYELSSFIFSEIPYIFFSILGIYSLFKNKYERSILFFIVSFLIRPIGIANIIIFFVYCIFKKINLKKFLIIFLIILFLVMAYNFLFNDSFTFSTTLSTNIKGDGLEKGMTSGNYLLSVFDKEYFEFFKDNLKRLYGQGSRACVFENCYIFNPLYRIDGSVPNVLSFNSIEIQYLNNFLIFVFEIGFPLGIWIYVPLIFLVLAFQKDYFSLLILFIFLLNILFSILTSEYGSRWWLYPNFLSVYLFPVSLGFIKNTLLTKFKR